MLGTASVIEVRVALAKTIVNNWGKAFQTQQSLNVVRYIEHFLSGKMTWFTPYPVAKQ